MSNINKSISPYGTWKSPITADLLTQKNVSFGEIIVLSRSSSHADIAYIENRPHEGGRAALIKQTLQLDPLKAAREGVAVGQPFDLSQGEYNVRSGVHEYGGGAVAELSDRGSAIFTDYKTFGVFKVDSNGQIRKITKDNKAFRYADFSPHPNLPLVLAVQEDHSIDEPSKVINTIVAINTETSEVHEITSGNDFYTNPRFSPDGKHIAYVTWNFPSMPFWATELWIAKFDASKTTISSQKKISGNNTNQIAHNPLWSDNSTLYFTSDKKTGFANLWSIQIESESFTSFTESINGDFASPAWTLGNSTFALLSSEWLISIVIAQASSSLYILHTPTRKIRKLDTPFVDINHLQVLNSSTIVFEGIEASQPSSLIIMHLDDVLLNVSSTTPKWQVIKRSSTIVDDGVVSSAYMPECEPIEFPTELPNGKKSTSHALLFHPRNPDYIAPAGTSPPCILKIHGGPTSVASPGLRLSTSYWTSRGYAICQVNYGGSTSFGREFMERLNGQWGVVDVKDTIAAATYLGSTKDDQKSWRRIQNVGQEQLLRLQEHHLPNGAVQFMLENDSTWWNFAKDAFIGALFTTASLLVGNLDLKSSVAVGALSSLISSVTRVQEERVEITPGIGIQLSTIRGLRFSSKRVFASSKKVQFIPRDTILDVFAKEAIRRWKVIDYLAVATHSASAIEKGNDHSRLTVLFPNLLPRLPIVEHVFRTIYPIIFGDSIDAHPRITNTSRVDPKKIAISGGSAGGYTVLAALCLYPSTFGAGADYYGVSSIAGLAEESHKFESQYVDQLMGGPPSKIPEVYKRRSPINMADRIESPLLILQGSEDKVVPPDQNIQIYNALKSRNRKTKYIEFPGEGHGFRKAENIKRSLEEEEAWYKEVFKL